MQGFLRKAALAIAAVSAFSFSNHVAKASDCSRLKLLTSIDTIPVQDNLAVLVPVELNGQKVKMLLDTGGYFSEVTNKAVKDLQLPTRHSRLYLIGVSADQTNIVARASSFNLGRLHADAIDFMVRDDAQMEKAEVAGIIAPNLLTRYDLDLDFTNHKFNLISPDHCRGKVIYWPAVAVAAVPIRISSEKHIILPVTLDGVRMNAMLDTGASDTTLNLNEAKGSFDLKPGSANTPANGTMPGRPDLETYHHRFHKLDFGGVAAGNLDVDIIPDLTRNWLRHSPGVGSRLSMDSEPQGLPDLLLGMDVLRHLHIYIAYKERMLYITPAAVPQATSAGSSKGSEAGQ
jgi:predicted aspartyl protease